MKRFTTIKISLLHSCLRCNAIQKQNTSDYFCEVQVREGSVAEQFIFKFTGVTKCMCSMLSRSVMSDSLRPHRLYSPRNSPGQNAGVGSLSLLQGIFPIQGSNPGLPHCRWVLYQLSHQGSLTKCMAFATNFFAKLNVFAFPDNNIMLLQYSDCMHWWEDATECEGWRRKHKNRLPSMIQFTIKVGAQVSPDHQLGLAFQINLRPPVFSIPLS